MDDCLPKAVPTGGGWGWKNGPKMRSSHIPVYQILGQNTFHTTPFFILRLVLFLHQLSTQAQQFHLTEFDVIAQIIDLVLH